MMEIPWNIMLGLGMLEIVQYKGSYDNFSDQLGLSILLILLVNSFLSKTIS
jgi:hypothetical protein